MLYSCVLAALLTTSFVQAPPAEDRFAAVRFLEGRWKGTATGEPGRGVSEREYRFEMKGRYLSVKNKSTWAIVEGKTEPEIHEDSGIAEPGQDFQPYSETRFRREAGTVK